jgi:hypothetical protein
MSRLCRSGSPQTARGRLDGTRDSNTDAWLWVPLLRLLAHGKPAAIAGISSATRRDEDHVRQALGALPTPNTTRTAASSSVAA